MPEPPAAAEGKCGSRGERGKGAGRGRGKEGEIGGEKGEGMNERSQGDRESPV